MNTISNTAPSEGERSERLDGALTPRRERTFRYSNCESLDSWLRCGWTVVAHYRSFWGTREAFILEWLCDCPLGTPKKYEKGLAGGQGPWYPVPMIQTESPNALPNLRKPLL